MKNIIRTITVIAGIIVFAGLAQAHHASFESDLEGEDSSLENPWRMFNGDINIAYDHFSFLEAGGADYLEFDGEAGQEVADIYVCFPATLTFLPSAAIVGPGLSGGSVPEWVEIPEGMGVKDYEYALDWLTEEAFGEGDVIIVLAYDEPMQFTLPETGTYWLVIYHEDKQAGYYDIAHGENHDLGGNAENWEAKFDEWALKALASESSSASDWTLYN